MRNTIAASILLSSETRSPTGSVIDTGSWWRDKNRRSIRIATNDQRHNGRGSTNALGNEVLCNRAIQLLGGELGRQQPVGPNDHVNMGQCSNDTFPTAIHIAAVTEVDDRLIPKVQALQDEIDVKAKQWADVVKIGRTHLEDAVPLTFGQEWSGYAAQLRACIDELRHVRRGLLELAVGATAVGTGLNAPAGFSADVGAESARLTGAPYVTAPNKFAALGSLDPMVRAHAALRGLAVALMKIAKDMRWLASGPRCGFGELVLPANEPGSSTTPRPM